ncbi:MAG: histidine--tRNA ligase [Planctomycetota bacterium]|jgi:histidyl-tRNA synthetase|nr:histidine--tRNA ligase [Planctomycetota bacterium]
MGDGKQRIQPRTLKGFRDYLPAAAIPREWLISRACEVYRSYGFSPIDTPALEYEEVLAGKGGEESEKQMFRFEDAGGRRVAMRFDLTVPLARFVAQYAHELGTPFKRYHIGPVWRGEKPQKGRYREFLQCDFDTVGTRSAAADIESGLVIADLLGALGFERFTVRVNDRRVLAGLLETLDLVQHAPAVLRALDKLDKIGPEGMAAELEREAGVDGARSESVLELAAIEGAPGAVLERVGALIAGSETGAAGVEALARFVSAVEAAGAPAGAFRIQPSLARGLDYYTGIVFETILDELPSIGSVCGGGRYDDLAQRFTKTPLPGVGASLGVDRLLAAMEELGMIEGSTTPADVFLPWFSRERLDDYLALAARLRAAGLAVEFYPEPKKLGAQLKYADRRKHKLAVIVGDDEWEAGSCQVKDLESGEARTVRLAGDDRAGFGDDLAAALSEVVKGRRGASGRPRS